MKLQEPKCMATLNLYGYLDKPARKSHRFVILQPGIVHGTRLGRNWYQTSNMFYTKS